jgi:membrane protease YdiL (CAAX protease family)
MVNELEQPADDSVIATAVPVPAQKKGRPIVAWVVILALVALILWLHSVPSAATNAAATEELDLHLMQMQARYFVGTEDLLHPPGKELFDQAKKSMDTGPVEQRLCFVILAGELAGSKEALSQLKQLDAKVAAAGIQETPKQSELQKDLRQLYQDYESGRFDAPALGEPQRQQLRTELGWFGQLALAPAGGPDPETRAAVLNPARRTVIALFTCVIGLGLLGLLGLVGLLCFVILLFSGKLRRGIHTGTGHGGVYAETFAVWMVLFLGLSEGAALLPFAPDARWLLAGVASLLSLSALFWPVLRGIPWQQVRWEIGWRAGKQPALEPVLGVATYAMALPLLVLGVIATVIILIATGMLHGLGGSEDSFNPQHYITHPVVEYVARPDWWARLQVLLLASVIAPIVEETMFRGVLYRHLREASSGLGFVFSILGSAVLVSFLFAVIHPQGLAAVPPLMALAFMFCLMREWRGSLLPSMIAHGINNGLVLSMVILAMGD